MGSEAVVDDGTVRRSQGASPTQNTPTTAIMPFGPTPRSLAWLSYPLHHLFYAFVLRE